MRNIGLLVFTSVAVLAAVTVSPARAAGSSGAMAGNSKPAGCMKALVLAVNGKSTGVVFYPGGAYHITGCGFGTSRGTAALFLSGQNLWPIAVLQVGAWSDTAIDATVPRDAAGKGSRANVSLVVRSSTGVDVGVAPQLGDSFNDSLGPGKEQLAVQGERGLQGIKPAQGPPAATLGDSKLPPSGKTGAASGGAGSAAALSGTSAPDLGLKLERVYRGSTEPCDHAYFPLYKGRNEPPDDYCLYAAKYDWVILLVTTSCQSCYVERLSVLAVPSGQVVAPASFLADGGRSRVAEQPSKSSSTVPTNISHAPQNQIYQDNWLDNYVVPDGRAPQPYTNGPSLTVVPGKTFILLRTYPAASCFLVRASYSKISVDTKTVC